MWLHGLSFERSSFLRCFDRSPTWSVQVEGGLGRLQNYYVGALQVRKVALGEAMWMDLAFGISQIEYLGIGLLLFGVVRFEHWPCSGNPKPVSLPIPLPPPWLCNCSFV